VFFLLRFERYFRQLGFAARLGDLVIAPGVLDQSYALALGLRRRPCFAIDCRAVGVAPIKETCGDRGDDERAGELAPGDRDIDPRGARRDDQQRRDRAVAMVADEVEDRCKRREDFGEQPDHGRPQIRYASRARHTATPRPVRSNGRGSTPPHIISLQFFRTKRVLLVSFSAAQTQRAIRVVHALVPLQPQKPAE